MLKLMLFLISILYSLSSTAGDGEDAEITCESVCRYQDYAKDAECTDRELSAVPSGCRGALNFDITFNNLTSLIANSFQGFFLLRWLHLEENQIVSIEGGAFLPLKRNLEMLNISSNQIIQLVDGTFVNMTKLKFLLLSDNQISYISLGAFKRMTKLSKLYLGNNRISALDPMIFNEMPRLTELNLRNNNLQTFDISFLDVLPLMNKIFVHRNALTEITGSISIPHNNMILINISSNNISTFDCTILENLNHLRNVLLGSNTLQTIQNCHNQQQLAVLRMGENPFHCDCNLRALQQWLQQHPQSPSPICMTPESVRSVEVRNLELDCSENDDLVGTTYPPVLDGFYDESTTSKQDLLKHTEISRATTKNAPKTVSFRLLTTIRLSRVEAVPANDHLKNEEYFKMEGTVFYDPTLLGVLGAIVIIFIIAFVLLILVLKNYCRPQPVDDKSAYWSTTKKYYSQREAGLEEGNEADENTKAGGHHYESIKDKQCQNVPLMDRHISIDTDTSETNMLPQTPDSGVFPYNNTMWDSDENSCSCTECHSPDSRGSTVDSNDENGRFAFYSYQEEIYSSSLSYPHTKYPSADSDITCQPHYPPPLPPQSVVNITSPYIAHTNVVA